MSKGVGTGPIRKGNGRSVEPQTVLTRVRLNQRERWAAGIFGVVLRRCSEEYREAPVGIQETDLDRKGRCGLAGSPSRGWYSV